MPMALPRFDFTSLKTGLTMSALGEVRAIKRNSVAGSSAGRRQASARWTRDNQSAFQVRGHARPARWVLPPSSSHKRSEVTHALCDVHIPSPHWHSYLRIFLPLAESSMAPMNFSSLPHLPQRGGGSGLRSDRAALSIFLILAPTQQPGRRESNLSRDRAEVRPAPDRRTSN
jgi:hypothetical protein